LTLLLLLIVITLDGAAERPWRRVWLGPLLAGVFFLKGMAVVLPLLLIALIECRRRMPPRDRWLPLSAATAVAAIPIVLWGVARWRVDRHLFFERMFFQDFVDLSTSVLDNHGGSPLFYLTVLIKHQYDWLVAVAAVALLYPPASWRSFVSRLAFWRSRNEFVTVLGAWIAVALIVPSIMQTKAAWYINPFYPTFALGVGCALSYGFSQVGGPRDRRILLSAAVVMALLVAEAKTLWYSRHYRALDRTSQGVLIAEADRLKGARIYNTSWELAELFVVRGLVRARPETITIEDFVMRAGPMDFIVLPADVTHPSLSRVAVRGSYALYQRRRRTNRAKPS
jgi:hypothetical protein